MDVHRRVGGFKGSVPSQGRIVNKKEMEARAPQSGKRMGMLARPLWLLAFAALSVQAQQQGVADAPPLSIITAPYEAPAPAAAPPLAAAAAPAQRDGAPPLTLTTALTMPADMHKSDLAMAAPAPTPLAAKPEAPAQAAMPPHAAPPPSSSAATDGDDSPLMKLGPGDTVSMQVYGRPELSTQAYISDDGKLNAPLVGPINIAGLSPNDAAIKIAEAYRSGGFLLQPQVNITLQQFKSQQISVLGEVKNPGRYALDSRTSIFDLLAQAGGAGPDAADTIYLIRHGDKDGPTQRIPVAMQELVRHSAGELSLHGGDSIYVPKAPQFYIYGEVRTPNRYKLDAGMTVVQAIAMGGGVTDRGSDSRVEVRRRNPDGSFKTFSAHATDTVQADDVIRIKERIF